jgi:hypothetical protein
MIKFVSYLNSAPANNKNPHKKEVLERFARGVSAYGDQSLAYDGKVPISCDVGFIQGWVHERSGSTPHLMLRKQVIDFQQKSKKNVLIVDSNLFNYKDKNKIKNYSRYSFDGVFPTTGQYFNSVVDTNRWQQISNDVGIQLKDWKIDGEYILICTQRNGGWSMGSLDVTTWLSNTINEIKKYTDRPIVVRPHPGDGAAMTYLKKNDARYSLSINEYIWQDFEKAKAVITYNSSPGVAGAIEGVPVFVTDLNPKVSQAFDVCNTDLSKIENPLYPERQHWINRLCMSHWNVKEISDGTAWAHIRNFVNQ